MKSFKISIIGSGRVATQLAKQLEKHSHTIYEVYSRRIENATLLAEQLYDAVAVDSLDFSESEAEIFIIAVADDAVSFVAENIIVPEDSIVAHTSGTLSMRVLFPINASVGVFYPLQTFSKEKAVQFKEIPICVEGNDEYATETLLDLADSLSKKVYQVSSEERALLHIAAVFACNFTNHLLHISQQILAEKDIDFTILEPLVKETIQKAFLISPEKAQTGPAIRKDKKTIEKHLAHLAKDPDKHTVYQVLTEHIMKCFANQKQSK